MNIQINRKAAIIMFTIYQLFFVFLLVYVYLVCTSDYSTEAILFRKAYLEYFLPSIFYTIAYAFSLGLIINSLRVNNLLYYFNEGVLSVRSGIFFTNSISIPAERITDISISQGPIGALFSYCTVQIQTASSGQRWPEATLVGLKAPEEVRKFLLEKARGK